MKEVILYAATLVAAVIVIAAGDDNPITPIPTECPKKDSVNFTVHIAHESNCSLFYMCARGHKILRICPLRDQEGNRLYFNPLLQVCDWPENAGCTSEDGATPEPPTTEPTEPTEIPITTSEIPITTTEVSTISTEIPISTTEISITTTEVLTISTEIPITTTEIPIPTTEVPTISTEIPTTNTEIPITTTEIPITTMQVPTILTEIPTPMPSTEMPITTTEISTASTEVPRTTTEISMTTENTPNIPDFSGEDSDYIIGRSARSISHPTVTECPLDLLLGTTSIKIPHESDCRLYYTCENGTKILNECDEGLNYNSLLQMCDWATEFSCSEASPAPTPIPTSKPSPTTNATTCPEVDTDDPVLLPHECACDKYYQCCKGEQILKKCPKGKGFNSKLGKCLSLNHSDCLSNDSEIPEDKDPNPSIPPANEEPKLPAIEEPKPTEAWENPSTCVGRCPAVDPIGCTVMLENTVCTRFCKCSNGRPYVYRCPSNLEFNPKLKVCDYPARAGCRYTHEKKNKSTNDENSFYAQLFHWGS